MNRTVGARYLPLAAIVAIQLLIVAVAPSRMANDQQVAADGGGVPTDDFAVGDTNGDFTDPSTGEPVADSGGAPGTAVTVDSDGDGTPDATSGGDSGGGDTTASTTGGAVTAAAVIRPPRATAATAPATVSSTRPSTSTPRRAWPSPTARTPVPRTRE
jgi:hypothetical protein